jgi:hypothetical protein
VLLLEESGPEFHKVFTDIPAFVLVYFGPAEIDKHLGQYRVLIQFSPQAAYRFFLDLFGVQNNVKLRGQLKILSKSAHNAVSKTVQSTDLQITVMMQDGAQDPQAFLLHLRPGPLPISAKLIKQGLVRTQGP